MEKLKNLKKPTFSSLKSFIERNANELSFRDVKDGDAAQWHSISSNDFMANFAISDKDTFKLYNDSYFMGIQIKGLNHDVVIATKK